MFRVNEIKSWAKKRGVVVKKQGEGYVWFAEGDPPSEPKTIEEVAKEIFNRTTDCKFVEYQKNHVPSPQFRAE